MTSFIYLNCSVVIFIIITSGLQVQTILRSENIDSGSFPFVIWEDGDNDGKINSSSVFSGTNSIYIQDDSGSSLIYANDLDFRCYESLSKTFFRTDYNQVLNKGIIVN